MIYFITVFYENQIEKSVRRPRLELFIPCNSCISLGSPPKDFHNLNCVCRFVLFLPTAEYSHSPVSRDRYR